MGWKCKYVLTIILTATNAGDQFHSASFFLRIRCVALKKSGKIRNLSEAYLTHTFLKANFMNFVYV